MRAILILLAAVCAGVAPAAAQHRGHDAGGTPASAAAIGHWTGYPTLRTVRAGRAGARVLVSGVAAEAAAVLPPEGAPWEITLDGGEGRFEARGGGNYHWLVVREEGEGLVRIATAAQYFSGPGTAPAALLAKPMAELEVVPDPIPREHAHYRAGEKWPFLVRFRGQPLADARVRLHTGYGSRISAVTGGDGRVVLPIPDDMPAAVAGGKNAHGRPPKAPLVVAVEHEADGIRYVASFSAGYRPNAFADRALWPGVAFMGLGMLAAAPLWRRKRKEAR